MGEYSATHGEGEREGDRGRDRTVLRAKPKTTEEPLEITVTRANSVISSIQVDKKSWIEVQIKKINK